MHASNLFSAVGAHFFALFGWLTMMYFIILNCVVFTATGVVTKFKKNIAEAWKSATSFNQNHSSETTSSNLTTEFHEDVDLNKGSIMISPKKKIRDSNRFL